MHGFRWMMRALLLIVTASTAAALLASPQALADATDEYPIPSKQIETLCDAEQYLAAARDTSPIYSENTATNIYYEQVATRWGNWAKVFFNNKGVVAKAAAVCTNYPRGDLSVWDWPVAR